MSKIVIKVENVTNKPAVIMAIRKATGMGMGEINTKIEANQPIGEFLLFENNHVEIDKVLRSIMADIPPTGATLKIYELPPEESYETTEHLAVSEITPEILQNLLDSADFE